MFILQEVQVAESVTFLKINPTERYIAIGTSEGTIVCFEFNQEEATLENTKRERLGLFLNLVKVKQNIEIKAHKGEVTTSAWAKGRPNIIITAGIDKRIVFSSVSRANVLQVIDCNSLVTAITVDSSENPIVYGLCSNHKLATWSMDSTSTITDVKLTSSSLTLALNGSEEFVVVGTEYGKINVYRSGTLEFLFEIKNLNSVEKILSIEFADDWKFFVSTHLGKVQMADLYNKTFVDVFEGIGVIEKNFRIRFESFSNKTNKRSAFGSSFVRKSSLLVS